VSYTFSTWVITIKTFISPKQLSLFNLSFISLFLNTDYGYISEDKKVDGEEISMKVIFILALIVIAYMVYKKVVKRR